MQIVDLFIHTLHTMRLAIGSTAVFCLLSNDSAALSSIFFPSTRIYKVLPRIFILAFMKFLFLFLRRMLKEDGFP